MVVSGYYSQCGGVDAGGDEGGDGLDADGYVDAASQIHSTQRDSLSGLSDMYWQQAFYHPPAIEEKESQLNNAQPFKIYYQTVSK